MKVTFVSGGFGPNEFWSYMIDMVHTLNGHDSDLPGMGPTNLTGGYGRRSGGSGKVRKFPLQATTQLLVAEPSPCRVSSRQR
jgi:hypothetical protein